MAEDPIRVLRRRPKRSAVLLDFDGTLSPIVDDPAAARPLSDIVEILERLGRRFALVAVLSGRPVDFLTDLLPSRSSSLASTAWSRRRTAAGPTIHWPVRGGRS